MEKSYSVFIENAQAVAEDSLKPSPCLDRTPRRHIDFHTKASSLTNLVPRVSHLNARETLGTRLDFDLRFVKNMMLALPKPV